MGNTICEVNILTNDIWEKLYEIKDFSLLMKVIEHLTNLITSDVIIFHLCTIVYEKEALDRLKIGG